MVIGSAGDADGIEVSIGPVGATYTGVTRSPLWSMNGPEGGGYAGSVVAAGAGSGTAGAGAGSAGLSTTGVSETVGVGVGSTVGVGVVESIGATYAP